MNLLAPVKTIMTQNLATLSPNDKLFDVKEIFDSKRIHHIPIVKGEKLVGMVSKSDFLFFSRGFQGENQDQVVERFRLNTYSVKEIMTTGLATLEPNEKINVALEVFRENLFHAIPIVDKNKLVGIVTTFDIIENLAIDKQAESKYITS